LRQGRRAAEIRSPEPVDGRRQIYEAAERGFTQDTERASDSHAAFSGGAARRFFVEQDQLGTDRFRQQNRGPFAGLQFLQACHTANRILRNRNPGRQVGRPAADGFRGALVEQLRNDGNRGHYLTEQVSKELAAATLGSQRLQAASR
jgi:hypothetical protein